MTTWPQNAYVGQRVVCTASFQTPQTINVKVPEKGIVYAVREIRYDLVGDTGEKGVGFLLVEIRNERRPVLGDRILEPAFASAGFRPVDESKLDQFRKHLIGVPSYDTV